MSSSTHLRLRKVFQSALPLRGATCPNIAEPAIAKNFNPRSPCGERLKADTLKRQYGEFQSALPLRGATGAYTGNFRDAMEFQSALPLRGATATLECLAVISGISIRAPLAGSDRYIL